ncbi:hypothetical protein GCM10017710_34870 [Arthrobacter ramosus]
MWSSTGQDIPDPGILRGSFGRRPMPCAERRLFKECIRYGDEDTSPKTHAPTPALVPCRGAVTETISPPSRWRILHRALWPARLMLRAASGPALILYASTNGD